MISARATFLGAGHYKPLADALVEFAHSSRVPGNLSMEAGAGTAYYLARVVGSMPDSLGLAVDLSKYAARRGAKAHARVDSIVADVWDRLPVADEASGLTLNVFAPRQASELHRPLHRDGTLLVVTPRPDHLVELRDAAGLLNIGFLKIDPCKASRMARGFEPIFSDGREQDADVDDAPDESGYCLVGDDGSVGPPYRWSGTGAAGCGVRGTCCGDGSGNHSRI